MSAPSFLLANESNHMLLQSLLESMNAIIEHQYASQYDWSSILVLFSNILAKAIQISYELSSDPVNASRP